MFITKKMGNGHSMKGKGKWVWALLLGLRQFKWIEMRLIWRRDLQPYGPPLPDCTTVLHLFPFICLASTWASISRDCHGCNKPMQVMDRVRVAFFNLKQTHTLSMGFCGLMGFHICPFLIKICISTGSPSSVNLVEGLSKPDWLNTWLVFDWLPTDFKLNSILNQDLDTHI